MNNLFSKKRISLFFIVIVLIFLAISLVLNPEKYNKTCFNGIVLWATAVLPSLLPFFFITAILSRIKELSYVFNKTTFISKKLFNTNGICLYAFLMSVISGYPVGHSILNDLYTSNIISKEEVKKACTYSSTSGPLFIIGVVGINMFKSKSVGIFLYFIHIIATILCGITFRGKTYAKNNTKMLSTKCDTLINDAIYASVSSVLLIGGFVSVFYVFAEILCDYKIFSLVGSFFDKIFHTNSGVFKGFFIGLLECTNGANMLSSFKNPLTVSLTAFMLGFGGISVIFQSLFFLSSSGIKIGYILKFKLVQATYSFLLSIIFLYILKLV